MKTTLLVISMTVLLLAGCINDSAPAPLAADHPANPQGAEAAYKPASNILADPSTPPVLAANQEAQHDAHAAQHDAHAAPKAAANPAIATPGGGDHAGHGQKAIEVSQATQEQVDAINKAYLALTAMLAEDKSKGAADQLAAIRKAAGALAGAKEAAIKAAGEKIGKAVPEKAEDLEAVRKSLKGLSDAVIELAHVAPQSKQVAPTIYQAYCPHAKASWLQGGEKILNPYYGSEMLGCGKVTQKIQAAEIHKH